MDFLVFRFWVWLILDFPLGVIALGFTGAFPHSWSIDLFHFCFGFTIVRRNCADVVCGMLCGLFSICFGSTGCASSICFTCWYDVGVVSLFLVVTAAVVSIGTVSLISRIVCRYLLFLLHQR